MRLKMNHSQRIQLDLAVFLFIISLLFRRFFCADSVKYVPFMKSLNANAAELTQI